MRKSILALLGVVLVIAFFAGLSNKGNHNTEGSTAQGGSSASIPLAPAAAASPSQPAESDWDFDQESDAVTGVVTKYATTKLPLGEQAVVVRRRGDHVTEVFVKTGEFLETMENVETGESRVAYKFDNGPVIRQYWKLSSDNTSLFYPGNPAEFLKKLRQAKKLAFQYSPADKVPQSLSFDVAGIPDGFVVENTAKAKPKLASDSHAEPSAAAKSDDRITYYTYSECSQHDPSLTETECNDRLRPNAPILAECKQFATEPEGMTQPEAYRTCAVKVPKK